MGWTVQTEEHKKTVEEIEKQTDRGAALMAGAFLEERLLQAIKATIYQNSRINGRMFRADGPLGSFSALIDLGFMLGIYGVKRHQTMHAIRRIRNDFAHKTAPLDFQTIDTWRLLALVPGDPKPLVHQYLKELDAMSEEQWEAQQKEEIPELAYFQRGPLKELGFTQPKSSRDLFMFFVKHTLLVLEVYILSQQTKERPKAWMA